MSWRKKAQQWCWFPYCAPHSDVLVCDAQRPFHIHLGIFSSNVECSPGILPSHPWWHVCWERGVWLDEWVIHGAVVLEQAAASFAPNNSGYVRGRLCHSHLKAPALWSPGCVKTLQPVGGNQVLCCWPVSPFQGCTPFRNWGHWQDSLAFVPNHGGWGLQKEARACIPGSFGRCCFMVPVWELLFDD